MIIEILTTCIPFLSNENLFVTQKEQNKTSTGSPTLKLVSGESHFHTGENSRSSRSWIKKTDMWSLEKKRDKSQILGVKFKK